MSDLNINAVDVNPIIIAHEIFNGLEKDANDLVERAGKDSEIRKDLWKITNSKKAQEQQQQAGLYANMAYLGVAITAVNIIAGVATVVKPNVYVDPNPRGQAEKAAAKAADALNKASFANYAHIASTASSNVSDKILTPYSQNLTSNKQVGIEAHTNDANDLWAIQQDISTSRKEQLQNVKRSVNDAAGAAVNKLGECMSTR